MRNLQSKIVLFTLIVASTIAVAQPEVVKAGKKGDIQLSQETKVGDVVLQPGHYQIQHRVDGQNHYIRFVQFKGHPTVSSRGAASEVNAGEIKCSVEKLQKKAAHTAVYTKTEGGAQVITRVEIQGDNVAHLF